MAAAAAWAVQIDNDREVLQQDPGSEATAWNNVSIYRVPTHICNGNGMAFRPQVVSLGPYHHGEGPLSLMEAAKRRALVHLLRDTDKSVNEYLDALRPRLETVMEAYEQLDERWEDLDEFLQMMVLDGCFVIEILRKNFTEYALSDPVFSALRQPTIIQYLRRDLLLLENQLPLVVLETLGDVVAPAAEIQSDIKSLILAFCFPDNNGFTYRGEGVHMLDVARQSMLRVPDEAAQEQTGGSLTWNWMAKLPKVWNDMKSCMNDSWLAYRLQQAAMNVKSNEVIKKSGTKLNQAWIRLKQITKKSWCAPAKQKENDGRSTKNSRSAKELHQVGINFQRSESIGLRGIKFEGNNLQLPTIIIDHNSESMFLNFIAFEQLHFCTDRFVTSYFLFMGGLITSIEDVTLLKDNDIIKGPAADEESVARMIKKLTKGLSFSNNDIFYKIQRDLNEYYTSRVKRCKRKAKTWYSNLCDTYFASPWTIIKLAAGCALLGLTTVGTIYTILQLYKGNH